MAILLFTVRIIVVEFAYDRNNNHNKICLVNFHHIKPTAVYARTCRTVTFV